MKCALLWSALSVSFEQISARVGQEHSLHRLIAPDAWGHAGNFGLKAGSHAPPSRAWPDVDHHQAAGDASLPFSVCAMGDSITDGVQGQDDVFVTRGGFRPQLDEWLKAEGAELTGYQTCPCPAYPGAISNKLHEQLVKDHFTCGSDSGPRHPDLALVLIGVNDLGRFRKPVDAAKDVETMLIDLWKASPRTIVLLASTLTHGAYPTAELNGALQSLVKKLNSASHPIEYVPMQEKTQMCNPSTKLCSYDLVHPNGDGYARMAQVWWEHIEPRLPKSSAQMAEHRPPARSKAQSYRFLWMLVSMMMTTAASELLPLI